MAKGKKTGGKNWVKGQSGNAMGPPKLAPAVKQFRKLTKEIVEEVGSLILEANESALYAVVHDTEASALKKWIASAALNGMQIGDMDTLDKLLNRLIGRVQDKPTQTVDALEGMTDDQKIEALESALAFLKGKQTQ